MPYDPTEEWRPAPGFGGRYSVSSLGRIRRDLTGRILKPWTNSRGYRVIGLPWDGNKRRWRSHKVAVLVAESFLGSRPPKMQVNHIDGVKTNNHLENLEWVTPSRNIQHSWGSGLRDGTGAAKGMRHGSAKLTNAEVLAIRAATDSHCALGRKYGVSDVMIGKIKHRQAWTHL